MLIDSDFESLDPEGPDSGWDGWRDAPVPDAVDLVLEAATLESVFAAQRLKRVDAMRRELLADAAGRGVGVVEVVERSIRLELAAAMRITEYAAGRMIVHAEALTRRYPAALDALGGGGSHPSMPRSSSTWSMRWTWSSVTGSRGRRSGWRRRSRWARSGGRCGR